MMLQSKSVLDDIAAMRQLDPSNILQLTADFPVQCRTAYEIGEKFALQGLSRKRPINNIVLSGLGGSAIGGDMIRILMEEYGDIPMIVNRDYALPGFVGKDTFVICASYSGGTEETLSAYNQARARNAQIVCVTSGGELAERANRDGVPVCTIPGGQPPRTATGYMFFPMLSLLSHLGLFSRSLTKDIEETMKLLADLNKEYSTDIPTENNPAKQLAIQLDGRIPVIYGSQGYRGVVALRWKCQFNENAKEHAFANVFPEQNHNEILAWKKCRKQAPRWFLVYLRDPSETSTQPRIARRVEVMKKLAGHTPSYEAWAKGDSLMAKMFSLFYLGDYVSIYAAFLNDMDPTNIDSISKLKVEMKKLKA
jgi:glucose/mannose-6-phosphate isomerase